MCIFVLSVDCLADYNVSIPSKSVNATDLIGRSITEGVDNGKWGLPTQQLAEDIDDVHIIGYEQVENGDGSSKFYGFGQVEGHSAEFVDEDGDGVVDTVRIDTNDNGEIELNEVYEAPGLTVRSILAGYQSQQADIVDESLGEETPDYTNDTDVSDF